MAGPAQQAASHGGVDYGLGDEIMDGGDFGAFYAMAIAGYLVRVTSFVGGSAFVLWVAYRYQPRRWVRRCTIAAVAAFWIVDLVPRPLGFWNLCQTQAGVRVDTPVLGRPHVAIGDQIEQSIAARFLYASGSVEYELTPNGAGRLGLRPGFHRFQAIENAHPDCWLVALRDSGMLAQCATAVSIDAPTARYLFDASEPRNEDRQAGTSPRHLSWSPEKDQAYVLDRDTNETLATATLFSRHRYSPVSGLLWLFPWDWACPLGATRSGLPYLLVPAAFPELTGS